MTRLWLIGLIGALWMLPAPAGAQPASTSVVTTADVRVLARFEAATALAVDPAGRLYVTDAGADAVVQLTPDGAIEARYGGPGAQPGAFDRPADVEPTNGLSIYVADAGNGRVQHFARAFQFLSALPVGDATEDGAGPRYDAQAPGDLAAGTGTPQAVVASPADDVYVLDAAARHVVYWGPQRQSIRRIGSFAAGRGALDDPVALALGPDGLLYVADRGRAAIQVYDAFGTPMRTIADGHAADAVALTVVGGTLWLVRPQSVVHIHPSGHVEGQWAIQLEAPLVDAAQYGGRTYLLTARRLVAWTPR